MHISTMLIFWFLVSLVRNSVVLAVYLLFSVSCFFTVHEHYHRDGSVGQILKGCNVRIQSDAAHPAVNDVEAQADSDAHVIGEIQVKGKNVTLGYYRDENATKEAFDGGWFKTGDLGYIDSDGFLYVTGRKKNLIILSNGENVSPEELETLLLDFELVKEVLVYAGDVG